MAKKTMENGTSHADAALPEIGGDRKLEGRRRRAGHGEDNAQAQDCRRAQDGTAYLAEHLVEGIAWATHRVHHEDAEAR